MGCAAWELCSILIFCSRLFSNSCSFFSLYEEYEIIFNLSTALAVSQRSVDDISGESFVSIKDVYSLLK